MEDNVKSEVYGDAAAPGTRTPNWLKVGVVAAATGILGGLAAAWYYRKTLEQLRVAEANGHLHPEQTSLEERDYDI